MNNVNLLPWREHRRDRKEKRMLWASVAFWLGCVGVVVLLLSSISNSIRAQDHRNQFLMTQNASLDRQIQDIKKLKEDKQELMSRLELVRNLQANRMQIVHVLDDIVRKLPSGVTLDKMSKQNKQIKLTGRAQSNARVSELMSHLDSSQWFGESNLTLVNVPDQENNKFSQFDLTVTEKSISLAEAANKEAQ